MRLLGRDILLGMARAHGDARKVQADHQLAHRALVNLHAKAPGDLVAQIHQAPTYHPVLLQLGSLTDPLGDRRLLLRIQFARRRASVRLVPQSFQPMLVETMHPVPQRLSVHPSGAPRLGAIAAL
jgi:hypothetical protein